MDDKLEDLRAELLGAGPRSEGLQQATADAEERQKSSLAELL